MAKETNKTFTYSCKPSIVEDAASKAYNQDSNISEKIRELLTEYTHNGNGIPTVISILCESLKNDKDYYMSWQANIAMATKDEFAKWKKKKKVISYQDMHTIANNAAKNFLNLLIK